MCLIAAAWQCHPRWPLVLIANRDEAHARPATPAQHDPDIPAVYGGRDLVAGGGWLQVSAHGRLAAVTNVRDGRTPDTGDRSRGWLVRDFVRSAAAVDPHARTLAPQAAQYGRFNLLTWDGDALGYLGNAPILTRTRLAPGMHTMSNGPLDAPWPKSRYARSALAAWLRDLPDAPQPPGLDALSPLFDALANPDVADDALLPDTGVGLALERALSPAFIVGQTYGTRCSSVVLAGAHGISFAERRFGPMGVVTGTSHTWIARTAPAGV